MEIAREIDTNINLKKALGIDDVSPAVLQELSKKGVVMLTYLFSACLRLNHVPLAFKVAQIIMLQKPGKPPNEVASYRHRFYYQFPSSLKNCSLSVSNC